jgi:hypothetical protein
MNNAGKGSSPRPFTVPLGQFNENFERIFGKKPKQCSTCHGTGEVITYQRDNKTECYSDECPSCDGKGVL